MYLALLLQRLGFRSLSVREAQAGRVALAKGTVDFLIVGDQAPSETPHSVIRKLTDGLPQQAIPVIVISQRDDPAERKACYDAGCRAYLLKPVKPKQLQDALYASDIPLAERRRNLRCTVDLPAEVTVAGRPPQSLRVLSLSRAGALLSAERVAPLGTEVALRLALDDMDVALTGSVIYVLAGAGDNNLLAFAVLFDQAGRSHGDLIDQYLERILEQDRIQG